MEPANASKTYNFICMPDDQDPEMMCLWSIEGLWEKSADFPVEEVSVSDMLSALENPHYLSGKPFTNRDMAEEARRVLQADLSYPIILFPGGEVMDGAHRIAKAWILGHATIKAVRFPEKPEPDRRKTRRELGLLPA
jgi:hypothetical protein